MLFYYLLIVNIIAQKISLTIQILIAIPELPVYGLPEIFFVRTVTPVCIVMGLFLYSSRIFQIFLSKRSI